ncbi:hypothetical protein B0H11DRAFT_2236376 [Mycena galericulata]|nr:hypothetical protein B0H11DRAFT_2236376 [Mycena galericulata]
MSPTQSAAQKAKATIQRRKDKTRLQHHAEAQQRYRDKNKDALREKARLEMQKSHRAAIKDSEERQAMAQEARREVDADYRERQRQKKFIQKFGRRAFEETYVPLYKIYGNRTGKLKFKLEDKAVTEARLREEKRVGVDPEAA